MEDLKERFDQGVGSMKKGFKTEKEKMELNKEIKELESKLQSLYNIRGKEVLKLGEGFYKKVRLGEIQNYDKDRKSTRLNSSHVSISYAVFCLKKKTTI